MFCCTGRVLGFIGRVLGFAVQVECYVLCFSSPVCYPVACFRWHVESKSQTSCLAGCSLLFYVAFICTFSLPIHRCVYLLGGYGFFGEEVAGVQEDIGFSLHSFPSQTEMRYCIDSASRVLPEQLLATRYFLHRGRPLPGTMYLLPFLHLPHVPVLQLLAARFILSSVLALMSCLCL